MVKEAGNPLPQPKLSINLKKKKIHVALGVNGSMQITRPGFTAVLTTTV